MQEAARGDGFDEEDAARLAIETTWSRPTPLPSPTFRRQMLRERVTCRRRTDEAALRRCRAGVKAGSSSLAPNAAARGRGAGDQLGAA